MGQGLLLMSPDPSRVFSRISCVGQGTVTLSSKGSLDDKYFSFGHKTKAPLETILLSICNYFYDELFETVVL
jgi:hypothetical protein